MHIPGDVEQRLGPKAALQFALDNNLPLKTSVGETDGRNVWNASVSGLRVPGDICGGAWVSHCDPANVNDLNYRDRAIYTQEKRRMYTEGPNKGYPKDVY